MRECVLYKSLGKNVVRCLACAHYCAIAPGATGICGVRQNINGKLQLLVYGQAAALNVDPMEKKPLYHFLPGERILSVGTVGCNFACTFCQNWDISQVTQAIKQQYQDEAYTLQLGKISAYGQEISPQQIVDYAVAQRIPAIAFTYNEPTIFFEYAYDTMQLAKARDIKTVFVSNGYQSREAIEKLDGYLDALNVDLKSFNPEFYLKTCKAKLEPVLENIKRLHNKGFWLELTTLLIPGKNDSDVELQAAAAFVVSVSPDIPWHFSAFHPDYKMRDAPSTSRETLQHAYAIAKEAGIRFVYVGNVYDPERESTVCPECGKLLIQRASYDVQVVGLERGACQYCKAKIPGVWH